MVFYLENLILKMIIFLKLTEYYSNKIKDLKLREEERISTFYSKDGRKVCFIYSNFV